jgi:hypothetical protein
MRSPAAAMRRPVMRPAFPDDLRYRALRQDRHIAVDE